MADVREVWQCEECGSIWEEHDKEKGVLCNCGNHESYWVKSKYCEECDTIFVKDLDHFQKTCNLFKETKN